MNVAEIKQKYLGDKRQTGQLGVTRSGHGYKMSSNSENAIESKKLTRERNKKPTGYKIGSTDFKIADKAVRAMNGALGDLEFASTEDNALYAAVKNIWRAFDTYKKLLGQKAKGGLTSI